jgi:hypothetical protein
LPSRELIAGKEREREGGGTGGEERSEKRQQRQRRERESGEVAGVVRVHESVRGYEWEMWKSPVQERERLLSLTSSLAGSARERTSVALILG